ncbi:MAG: hypothetical protein CMJ64_10240 [Planctomycetaceae bacterium]|nr:hypothetical protein [Planctomycetaceae bacterium]
MSLHKITACLAALVLLAFVTDQAMAQRQIHHTPPWIDGDGADPDYFQPFVDGAFEHDFQFFAQPEFGEFGDGPDLNTGWFATADRVYISMNRPVQESTNTEGDFTWGNRFTVGYMTEEDHGWFIEHWHIDGPNHFDTTEAERVNIINPDDEINGDPENVDLRGGGGGAGGMAMANPQRNGLPVSDRNNATSQDRRYFLRDSINNADLTSFELNKSFRWKTRHYGSIIEPFVGFRYIKYQDFFQRDSYIRIDDMGVPVGQVPPFTQDTTLLEAEQFTSLQSGFNNHLVGGQFGFRSFKHKSRWNLSSELRIFAFQNFQFQEEFTFTELTFYDGGDAGAMVDGVFVNHSRTGTGSATEFVFGGEVRAQAAYEVTRDLSIRGGITAMNLAAGIGRGNNILDNQQSVVMFGMTFGIDYRR